MVKTGIQFVMTVRRGFLMASARKATVVMDLKIPYLHLLSAVLPFLLSLAWLPYFECVSQNENIPDIEKPYYF